MSYPYSSPSVQSTRPYSAQKERFHRSYLCHPEAQWEGQGAIHERGIEQTKEGDKKERKQKEGKGQTKEKRRHKQSMNGKMEKSDTGRKCSSMNVLR